MIYSKTDSNSYIQEFKKKFTNFCSKMPTLVSFTIKPTGVSLVDEIKRDVYDIDFDFSIDVKSFIFGIKSFLIERDCYPYLDRVFLSEEDISIKEQLSLSVNSENLDSIPVKRSKKSVNRFLIDKVIVFKDIFILKEFSTGKTFRYKMTKSCILFLKHIRSGKMNPEQAADFFFENSELVNEIVLKEDLDD